MFLRTERLMLRPGWTEDAPALAKAIGDERIVRNLASAPWPYTVADAEAFLATERRPVDAALLVFLAGETKAGPIGSVGFGRRPSGEIEFGYWFVRQHWGRGYATEAGKAVVAMARESLRVKRLSSGHFLDNPASGRVLEKLGFRPTGAVVPRFSAGRGEAVPCRLFELDLDSEEEPAAIAA